MISRLRARGAAIPRRERLLVAGAMAAAVAVVVAYVLTTRSHPLSGDEPFYHEMARFWADGKLWWTTMPFGEAHASAWKPPLYPAFTGTLYAILGESPLRVELAQAPLAAVTVFFTWALARRLFGPPAAVTAAWLVAIFPLAFEYYGLLFPEALAVPLTVLTLYLFLGREPTRGRALAVGVAVGAGLLVRPTGAFLLAGVLAAFVAGAGWRRGTALTLLAAAAAALVVAPWTVRNYVVLDGLVPISLQDGAIYGTFNPETAADTEHRWAWRAFLRDPPDAIERREPNEAELRAGMQSFALDYVREHPDSVPKAFFWNGIVRFWDLRPPGEALGEVSFQGRSRTVRAVGLGMHYLLLPLALAGLWRVRRRRAVFAPVVAVLVAASLSYTMLGGTRYRAPLQPLVVILAASVVADAASRLRTRSPRGTRCPGTP